MSTWECWLFRSICMCKNMCKSFIVMHTCEMFFHALVCMHWACFGSITLAFLLVCAPAMYMCCKLVPSHLCVSLKSNGAAKLASLFPWLLRATVRQRKFTSRFVLCQQQLCHANLLYRSKCQANLNLPNDLYMSAMNQIVTPHLDKNMWIFLSHRRAMYHA